jgi:hypothetical protein
MGLTTHFFNPAPKLNTYTNRNGYGNRLKYNEMDVSRIMDCMNEMVMETLTG